MRRCADCRHYQVSDAANDLNAAPMAGECRRNPPVQHIVPMGQSVRGIEMGIRSHFTPVQPSAWCGEWQPASVQ